MESREFTVLHKIVIGLLDKPLAQELEASTAGINAVDAWGLSPLHWAASRRDVASLQLLLDSGGNPNLVDIEGRAPHDHAALAGSVECVRALIANGADIMTSDVMTSDVNGKTALHRASRMNNDKDFLIPLVAAGANLDAVTHFGHTPLMSTVYFKRDHSENSAFAFRCGADSKSELVDKEGNAAIFYAVRYSTHTFLQLLLEGIADPTLKNKNNETILKFASLYYADLGTFQIRTRARLRNVDVMTRAEEGDTAWHRVLGRDPRAIPVGPGPQEAFKAMLNSYRKTRLSPQPAKTVMETRLPNL